MDLRIYGKKEKGQTHLRLVDHGDGIVLIVCDKDGERCLDGYLLKITTVGKLYLYSCINKDFGFYLKEDGSLRMA